MPFFAHLQQAFTPIIRAFQDPSARPCVISPHPSSIPLVLSVLAAMDVKQLPGTLPLGSKHTKAQPGNITLTPSSWLIITPTPREADGLYQDLQSFYSLFGLPEEYLMVFPPWTNLPYQSSLPPKEVIAQRGAVLHRLTERAPCAIVTSIQAVLQKLLPQSVFSQSCLSLKPGLSYERESFIRSLIRIGYQRTSLVEIPGEYSIRGGLLDVFSTAYLSPLRVEFLGDTIESVRLFDPATQESIQHIHDAWILPARECVSPIDMTESLSSALPSDAEWRNPHIYSDMPSLVQYFSSPPHVVFHHPYALEEAVGKCWNQILEVWDQQTSSTPEPFPEPDQLYFLWEEIESHIQSSPVLGTDAVTPPQESPWNPILPIPAQSPTRIGLGVRGTPFTETLAKLNSLREQHVVFVIARNSGQVERLLALFSEHGYPAIPWDFSPKLLSPEQHPPFFCLPGELSIGVISHEGQVAFVTEEELFGKGIRHRPQQKTSAAKFLSSLDDLAEGDLVVHVHHGIARYKGLRRLSVNDFESDYLLLQFAGTDTLYVPLDRLNHIQRYRGADRHQPKLDRLGGTSWGRTKAKVKKGIEEMTHELLALYANREVVRRPRYSTDSILSHEFDAAFDYEETPDQLRAIVDIQRDMDSPKPMDRLVCGDVGYGKTEVAMRAAFKAVQDNRQVAVLAPTTLLAQQHYETFSLRFAPFPVRVGMLSRFQTPAETKAILKDAASGALDILIGTHRLLQKDVRLKNLGLVITDEEQWFGVRHKERLKQLRTQVDVLTLSATPIPRTLQMAFSGVRDLSVIETPPPGRMAIQTQVLRFDPSVIREGIQRELSRGGQVFYVHNRVQTMEQTATWVQSLVPEMRVVIAHGQMDARLLESVMLKFLHQEADILVASAIIQSGLDIPNANTIIIDRAELFGLAQLYQLRGRVGRGGQQAYAYLCIPNEELLSTDAQKRLTAIQEFADLGAGFRIAAADLEIRGAGNILGKQQSGNIASVGLDLYLQMMEQAVHQLKGQETDETPEPTLHLHVSAYIPEDYVDDPRQRLSLYKRLSMSERIGDLALLHGESQDRYGPLPEPLERLFDVMQIKILAKGLTLEFVERKGATLLIAFHERAKIPEKGIQWLMEDYQGRIHFLTPFSFEIQTGMEDWGDFYQALKTILEGLGQRETQNTEQKPL